MKLSYKLLSIAMGIVGLCSQANANQIRAYNLPNEYHSPPLKEPSIPNKRKENIYPMKAILEKDEETLEKIEIKNRKQ